MSGAPGNPSSSVPIPAISVEEAWKRASHPDSSSTLIDVREPWEYAQGHAAGARNIPLSELTQREREVPRDKEVLLICHLGGRSLEAAKFLRQQGVERTVNVTGGTEAWQKASLPME